MYLLNEYIESGLEKGFPNRVDLEHFALQFLELYTPPQCLQ
jgi:hypothetical protein